MTADAAYQGARGAFSEEAARALLGAHVSLLPCRSLRDVFTALAARRVSRAIVPVVNSIVGAVPLAAELMTEYRVTVIGEHHQPIDQSIIAAPGVTLPAVRRVWSHPVALGQCRRWFSQHPDTTPTSTFDTAGAVEEVLRRGDRTEAAIASKHAAEVYGGVVLEDRIQDHPDNFTRFVLVTMPPLPYG